MSEQALPGHSEVKGVIPMRPHGGRSATCTCGWHSHHKTFEQHLDDVKAAQS